MHGADETKPRPWMPENCPILERTGDGRSVGRCYFHLTSGMCPRHGDVGEAVHKHVTTGKLTDEKDLAKRCQSRTGGGRYACLLDAGHVEDHRNGNTVWKD